MLESCIGKLEDIPCDDFSKLSIISSMKCVFNSLKSSYQLTKQHLRQVNPWANQTEEAYDCINKRK